LSLSVININHTYLHVDIVILFTFTGKSTESEDVGAVVTSVFFYTARQKRFMHVKARKIVALRSER
jgi:hypothetical protein